MLRKSLVSLLMVSPLILAGCSVLPFSDRFGDEDKKVSKKSTDRKSRKERQKLAELGAGPTAPPSALLNSGIKNINKGESKAAQKAFDEVSKQHPFSNEAQRSLLLSAYTHFESKQYPQTISKAKQFIELYPGNKDAAYMQFLIGESYSSSIGSVVLDQGDTAKGLKAYADLVRLYPDSKYVAASKRKMLFLADQLAGKEMQVGRYYQERRQHLAAVNRFRTVVQRHQKTRHVEEALYRLSESYLALGLVNDAKSSTALLGHNYPHSQWYADAYGLTTGGRLPTSRQGVGSRLANIIPLIDAKEHDPLYANPDFVPADGSNPPDVSDISQLPKPVVEKKRGLSRFVPFAGKNKVDAQDPIYNPPTTPDFGVADDFTTKKAEQNVSFPPVPGLDDASGARVSADTPETVFIAAGDSASPASRVPGRSASGDASLPEVPGLETQVNNTLNPAPTADDVFLPAPGSSASNVVQPVAEKKRSGLSRFVPFVGGKKKKDSDS